MWYVKNGYIFHTGQQQVCRTIRAALNSPSRIVSSLHTITDYRSGLTQIADGGGDMYDGGNKISNANGVEFTYRDSCTSGTSPEPYFMDIMTSGLSVFYIARAATNSIAVNGNNGTNRLLYFCRHLRYIFLIFCMKVKI